MDERLDPTELTTELEKVAQQERFDPRWQIFDEDQYEPGTLWASVNTLLGSLEVTCSTLQGYEGTLYSIREQCLIFIDVVRELEEILVMYAKHPPNDDESPPIDPMICQWVNECSATVTELRLEAEGERDRQREWEDWDVVSSDGVESIADTLVEEEEQDVIGLAGVASKIDRHYSQMKEFLPILRCDMNDFLACRLASHIPQSSTPQPSYRRAVEHSHHLDFIPDGFDKTQISRVRSTLYELSDSIKALQSELNKYQSSLSGYGSPNPFPTDDNACVADLIAQNMGILEAIQEAQTNHGSEWIESMLAGRLTYAEYVNLDVSELTDLIKEYKTIGQHVIGKNRCRKEKVEKLKASGMSLQRMLRVPSSDPRSPKCDFEDNSEITQVN